MARNNEPAFRRKTPLLICSIRTEIPYPCIGSSANVFRMSISSVPWTRSLGLSGMNLIPLGYQEEHTLLLLVVKRKRPKFSCSNVTGHAKASFTPRRKKAVGNLPAVERHAKPVPAEDAIDFPKSRLQPGVVVVVGNGAAIPRRIVNEIRRIGEYEIDARLAHLPQQVYAVGVEDPA